MAIDDVFEDPEFQKILKDAQGQQKPVTQQEHEIYVLKLLDGTYQQWKTKSAGQPINDQYITAEEEIKRFRAPLTEKIVVALRDGYASTVSEARELSTFVTALIRSGLNVRDFSKLDARLIGEQRRFVHEELSEAFLVWVVKETGGTVEDKYAKAVARAKFAVSPGANDISLFCSSANFSGRPNEYSGLFVSALVNTIPNTNGAIKLDFSKVPFMNYFGYRLERDVEVIGDLRNSVGMRMQKGKLTVRGNCKGEVGLYMGQANHDSMIDMVNNLINGWQLPELKTTGPTIIVEGSIGDIGAVRYSGTIHYSTSKGYYRFGGIEDLKKWVKGEEHPFIKYMYGLISEGKPVTFYSGVQNVLHPALLRIAKDYNLGIYQRQVESWKTELQGQRDYKRRLEEWEQKNSDQASMVKGGGALIAALIAIPLPGTLIFSLPLYFTMKHGVNKEREKERGEFDDKWGSANWKIQELERQITNYEKLVSVTQNLFR